MARDGSGNYNLPEAAFIPGTTISSAAVNSNFSDIANALSGSLTANGEKAASADQPMGGNKHTGVGNATARTHYAAAGQIQDQSLIWCGTAGGTANAITLSPTPAITAYANGQRFVFVASAFNTGATTIVVSGLAATACRHDGAALVGDEIWTGDIIQATYYDGNFYIAQESPRIAGTAGSRNWIENAGFNIAQWGVTGTVIGNSAAYLIDRWLCGAGATNVTVSRLAMTPGETNIPHQQPYYLRLSSATAAAGVLVQNIDDVRSLAGKQVTLTFWARSNTAGATITPNIQQYFGSGGSTTTNHIMPVRTLSTVFDRYRQTVTMTSISGKTIGAGSFLAVRLDIGAAAGKNVDIAYVQLEEGPRYTVISPTPLELDLQACKRHYQSSYAHGTAEGTATFSNSEHGPAVTTLMMANTTVRLPVQMREAPTVRVYSTGDGAAGNAYDLDAATNRALITGVSSNDQFIVYSNGGTFVAGNRMAYHWVADARS